MQATETVNLIERLIVTKILTIINITNNYIIYIIVSADKKQHGEGLLREKGKKPDGSNGVRFKSQRRTEIVGGKVLRRYVPHGTKRIGECDHHSLRFISYKATVAKEKENLECHISFLLLILLL